MISQANQKLVAPATGANLGQVEWTQKWDLNFLKASQDEIFGPRQLVVGGLTSTDIVPKCMAVPSKAQFGC